MENNVIESRDHFFKKSAIFNYSDIFFSYFFNDETHCTHSQRNHALSYVYSGEMLLEEGDRTLSVRKGECVFIKRDHRVKMQKRAYEGEQYSGIFMMFDRGMLRRMYRDVDSGSVANDAPKFRESFFKIEASPEVESLFGSMVPYFNRSVKPNDELMRHKLQEGVMILLNMDERFYPTLFDFAQPWKIDILDFLNENYMYDLSMEEIANFTGRSLATFKRDFKKISSLTPQKWLINKRLEIAYGILKEEGKRINDVYTEVGFKNQSHFTTAFKKQFGFPPTGVSK